MELDPYLKATSIESIVNGGLVVVGGGGVVVVVEVVVVLEVVVEVVEVDVEGVDPKSFLGFSHFPTKLTPSLCLKKPE